MVDEGIKSVKKSEQETKTGRNLEFYFASSSGGIVGRTADGDKEKVVGKEEEEDAE